jgi:hypothetical protein
MALIIIIFCIVFMNIIFGYWRSNTRKFSVQWILSIHVPVIVEIFLRMYFLEFNWFLIPLFVCAFASGQFLGGRIRNLMAKGSTSLGSFLIGDLFRILAIRYKNI